MSRSKTLPAPSSNLPPMSRKPLPKPLYNNGGAYGASNPPPPVSRQYMPATSSPTTTTTTSSLSSSSSTGGRGRRMMSGLSYKPTLLEVQPMRFIIMDAPRPSNLHLYLRELTMYHVKDVVRVCEPTYSTDAYQNAGMTCHDLGYPDGRPPPWDVIEQWLQLVESTFYQNNKKKQPPQTNEPPTYEQEENGKEVVVDETVALAVHCVAGLGRAPMLVAVALMEFAYMDAVEAVAFIRRHRKGSINEKQLLYLESYKRRYKRRGGDGGSSSSGQKNNNDCVIL